MAGHSKISLYFPDKHSFSNKKQIVLGGDVGGTKVNLAIFEADNNLVRMIKSSTYHSSGSASVNDIIKQFLKENPEFLS